MADVAICCNSAILGYHQRMERKDSLFSLDGSFPGLGYALPVALQHLVVMIVGCVTPAIIISDLAGLSASESTLMIQTSLMAAGLSTLIQLFIGSRLPMIMGISFSYLASMQAIVSGYGLAEIFGAQIVGGAVAFVIGLAVKRIRRFFPPMITGTVVFTIGLSLYPTAITYMAGGQGNPDFGSWQNWTVAIITFAAVVILSNYTKGFVKLSAILIGIAIGYVIAIPFGLVDFSGISSAGVIELPRLAPFGISFALAPIITFSILFAINSIQAIGDMSATTLGSMDREPTDDELRRGIMAYGAGNMAMALISGLPTASFSQNVGVVTTTKVVNRKALSLVAFLLIASGMLPVFSAFLTTIPSAVLGGATVSVFASIAMTGMKLVMTENMGYRTTSIVGLSAALGVGISQVSGALEQFPDWVTLVFAKSPVVVATIVAITLNLALPKEDKKL